jgi:hypothetical protein
MMQQIIEELLFLCFVMFSLVPITDWYERTGHERRIEDGDLARKHWLDAFEMYGSRRLYIT